MLVMRNEPLFADSTEAPGQRAGAPRDAERRRPTLPSTLALAGLLALALPAYGQAGAPTAAGGDPSGAPTTDGADESADDQGDEQAAEDDEDPIFAAIERAIFDLHAVRPRELRPTLASLEALKPKRPTDPRLLGALARAYALRAALDGDERWVRGALETGLRAVQLQDRLAITHAGHAAALVARARFTNLDDAGRARVYREAADASSLAAEQARDAAWVDLCLRGEALLEGGHLEDASEAYQAAARANPLAWEPLEGAAEVARARGQIAQAAALLGEATARVEQTARYLQSDRARREAEDTLIEMTPYQRAYRADATARAPREAERLRADQAALWLTLGEPGRAAEALGAPADGEMPRTALRRAFTALAGAGIALEDALARLGPLPEAPTSEDHAARAELLRRLGKLADARAQCELAVRTTPIHPLAPATLAEIELAEGRVMEALRLSTEAMRRNVDEPARWRLLARARAAQGDAARAAKAEAKAAELELAIAAARAEGADLETRRRRRRARALVQAFRHAEAKSVAEPLAAKVPDDLEAALVHASALAGLRQRGALAEAERALALAPKALDAVIVCARAALAEQRRAEARERALQALAIAPRSPEARDALTLIDTAGLRSTATAEVEAQVQRLQDAAVTERRALVQNLVNQRNLAALLLHLSAETDDEALASMVQALSQAPEADVQKSLRTRGLSIGPEQPKAQLALVTALAVTPDRESAEVLAAIAARPGSPEIRALADDTLGKLAAQLPPRDLVRLLGPSSEHRVAVAQAHDRHQTELAESDPIALGFSILKWVSALALVVFGAFAYRDRQRRNKETEARAAKGRARGKTGDSNL